MMVLVIPGTLACNQAHDVSSWVMMVNYGLHRGSAQLILHHRSCDVLDAWVYHPSLSTSKLGLQVAEVPELSWDPWKAVGWWLPVWLASVCQCFNEQMGDTFPWNLNVDHPFYICNRTDICLQGFHCHCLPGLAGYKMMASKIIQKEGSTRLHFGRMSVGQGPGYWPWFSRCTIKQPFWTIQISFVEAGTSPKAGKTHPASSWYCIIQDDWHSHWLKGSRFLQSIKITTGVRTMLQHIVAHKGSSWQLWLVNCSWICTFRTGWQSWGTS